MGDRVRLIPVGSPSAFDDPIVIEVNDFGPHTIARNYNFESSGILIRRDSAWSSGTLTINLNGHTLTFGAGALSQTATGYNGSQTGNVGHVGILCPHHRLWNTEYFSLDGYFGYNTTANLACLIQGPGTIRTGGGAGLAYGFGINISGIPNFEIDNVTINLDAPDTMAIYGAHATGEVHDSTIDIEKHPVANRHQSPSAIKLHDGTGSKVYDNTIVNSLQVGIFVGDDSEVYGNAITLDVDSTAVNAYGISAYETTGHDWHDNNITGTGGRGIHVQGYSLQCYDNVIDVTEVTGSGAHAHGIKIEQGDVATVTNNTIIARCSATETATALNSHGFTNFTVSGGTYEVVRGANTPKAYAICLPSGDQATNEIRDATFKSDSHFLRIEWAGAQNLTCRGCTFELTGGTDEFVEYFTGTGVDATGHELIDCTFTGGADPTTATGNSRADGELSVKYTITVDGPPNATIVIVDGDGATIVDSTLSGSGRGSYELAQNVITWDSASETTVVDDKNDYTFTIDGNAQTVTVDAAKLVTEP